MSTVKNSIDHHDTNHNDYQEHHVGWVLVWRELSGNVTLITLHEWVEQEHVNYEQYLNRSNIDIQVRPGLLLLDLWEETIHERIVID